MTPVKKVQGGTTGAQTPQAPLKGAQPRSAQANKPLSQEQVYPDGRLQRHDLPRKMGSSSPTRSPAPSGRQQLATPQGARPLGGRSSAQRPGSSQSTGRPQLSRPPADGMPPTRPPVGGTATPGESITTPPGTTNSGGVTGGSASGGTTTPPSATNPTVGNPPAGSTAPLDSTEPVEGSSADGTVGATTATKSTGFLAKLANLVEVILGLTTFGRALTTFLEVVKSLLEMLKAVFDYVRDWFIKKKPAKETAVAAPEDDIPTDPISPEDVTKTAPPQEPTEIDEGGEVSEEPLPDDANPPKEPVTKDPTKRGVRVTPLLYEDDEKDDGPKTTLV